MNKKYVIIIIVTIITIAVISHLYHEYVLELDPNYVKQKIKELEEMPCGLMSENHVHEIEDDEHYLAYDRKFVECFGYLP